VIPRIGEQLRITEDSDAALCTPGETVTVVQVETNHRGTFVYVDGRRDFRRFLWEETRIRRIVDDGGRQ
jgi:hypothetical protein